MAARLLGERLYSGQASFDFIGRRRIWYAVGLLLVVVSIGSLAIRGLNLGIDFEGGAQFRFPAQDTSISEVREVVTGLDVGDPVVQRVGDDLRVQTPALTEAEIGTVTDALSAETGLDAQALSPSTVSASWGDQVTTKAVQGLIFFLIAVAIFISIRFEWRMAVSAIVALLHDLVLTTGVYSLLGFEVTPGTVIGMLTILGYSLYDTVVVFDKVDENTRGVTAGSRQTYTEAADLAVNQTVVRSVNTSIIALLPVGGLLFIGAYVLGAGTLKDLALVLFVGMIAGTYSSIFIATPLLADLKEREPQYAELRSRVASRRSGPRSENAQQQAAAAEKARSTAPGRTVTAVLEREDAPYDAETAATQTVTTDAPRRPEATVAGAATGQSSRPRRQTPQRRRRKGGRGRPSGKRKR